MRWSWNRIAVAAVVAVSALVLSLAVAVAAGAGDGRTRDHGGTAQVRGHARGNDEGRQGDENGQTLLRSAVAPSLPTDPVIHGVAAGGLPWVLGRGGIRLRSDGRIRVTLVGLVIPVAHGSFPAGTARPVTTVSASLYCAPDSTAAAATTMAVPISADGDATIDDTITLPSTCLAPIVLVHPNGIAGAYIATSGWRS